MKILYYGHTDSQIKGFAFLVDVSFQGDVSERTVVFYIFLEGGVTDFYEVGGVVISKI